MKKMRFVVVVDFVVKANILKCTTLTSLQCFAADGNRTIKIRRSTARLFETEWSRFGLWKRLEFWESQQMRSYIAWIIFINLCAAYLYLRRLKNKNEYASSYFMFEQEASEIRILNAILLNFFSNKRTQIVFVWCFVFVFLCPLKLHPVKENKIMANFWCTGHTLHVMMINRQYKSIVFNFRRF